MLFVHAPEPTEDYIKTQQQLDKNRNPYNDGPPKPKLRDRIEIIIDFKVEYANMALDARNK